MLYCIILSYTTWTLTNPRGNLFSKKYPSILLLKLLKLFVEMSVRKIFESWVNDFLKRYNLPNEIQFAFQENNSTNDAAVDVSDII